MFGAIIGDIIGSRFERNNNKSKDFELFTEFNRFTDDTVMTVAVASALLKYKKDESQDLSKLAIQEMQGFGRRYPYAGYGRSFRTWLDSDDPQPYNSWGNGSAMRISPVGWLAESLEEVIEYSDIITGVTHDHPESLYAAEVVATIIFMLRKGSSKEDIRAYVEMSGKYDISFTLDEIRDTYLWSSRAELSVPQAIVAFLEGDSFEDVIRGAISIGGDSDTIAAIAGSMAEAYYDSHEYNKYTVDIMKYLRQDLVRVIVDFNQEV